MQQIIDILLENFDISYMLSINIQKLINSTIAAPVFYSWIMKPILTKYKIGYKNGTEIK